MNTRLSQRIAAVVCGCCLASIVPAAWAAPSVDVLVDANAPKLERFAAQELCRYLDALFGIKTQPAAAPTNDAEIVILVGSPKTNAVVSAALGADGWPKVSDQGIVLKRGQMVGRPALVLGGGSPRATLWAVYELVERWGVRYLPHGDVLPNGRPAFRLPDEDVAREPLLRVRQWRVVNAHAHGQESWGMADYRPLLDQLAKLKFNRILVSVWPYQPFVDLKLRGIERRSATLWWGHRFPITPDTIGRELFGEAAEFWNPDLPPTKDYKAMAAAGERLLHKLMAHAHDRGMECAMSAALGDFPPEFAPLLKDARRINQVGNLTIVPGPDTPPDDPSLGELAAAVLRTTVNTYPEVDYVLVGMPEHRQWVGGYQKAWAALDARYGIAKVRPLDVILADARRRKDYPGGPERAVAEVKGDLVALDFYDRLLRRSRALEGTRRPDMKFIYSNVAEELYPLLARLLPAGCESLGFIDYTPSRVVRRKAAIENVPSRAIPASLIFTLDDDNIGLMPQLMTGSLCQLTQELVRCGWSGFSTRYWILGGQDPCVAYLARAAWDRDAKPDGVARDQVRAACGQPCVDDMLDVFRQVEAATVSMEWHNLGLAFPVPDLMAKHWSRRPMSAELIANRRCYERALDAARRARSRCDARGRQYVDYWIGRLEFAVEYLNAVEAFRRAAKADAEGDRAKAIEQTEATVADLRRAIEAWASVARDQSDRGAVAQLNEFGYRVARKKLAELQSPSSPR